MYILPTKLPHKYYFDNAVVDYAKRKQNKNNNTTNIMAAYVENVFPTSAH